ncbi:glutathione S-transferase family protein [Zhongshania arctica]|uniref:Glutathione S-transferase family protein n=1 Tax=Zhongshania arctica TaxID=3238302 RepID=A0ABV3TYZ1_9GAMM
MSANTPYRLMGRPESGYSLKVRSALRYKNLPFEWMDRFKHQALYQQHAKVPLIPLLLLPTGSAMQDSTPILEMLEEQHPERSLHPPDPALRFLSELLEEYGDEWVNKLMFHYRWGYPADQKRRGTSLGRGVVEGKGFKLLAPIMTPIAARFIIKRMVPRMAFAGANENNAPILIASFSQLIDMLEAHLKTRPYLFGGSPAFADFGLWGQLWQAWTDASCETIIEQRAPSVVAWIKRMEHPSIEGEFESLDSLTATLKPIFEREVGPHFLAWSVANAKAYKAGEKQTELHMDDQKYYQKTFKYPASSLDILKEKFKVAASNRGLTDFLQDTHCLAHLQAQP